MELLDPERIRGALREEFRRRVHRLDVPFEVDSTSTRLLAQPPPPRGCLDVRSAELQHAGRGRGGRSWLSAFAGSLPLSLGWSLPAGAASPALSLAAGVAVWRALERFGAGRVRLKWPNDLWLDDRKVGGILVELRTEAGGRAHLVIGVGLNVSLSAQSRAAIEAGGVRIAALANVCATAPSRNLLAAALVEELLAMLGEFECRGFAAFRAEWTALDAMLGRGVRVHRAGQVIEGTSRGVDEDGALLLEAGGGLQRHASGEVSLRLNEGEA